MKSWYSGGHPFNALLAWIRSSLSGCRSTDRIESWQSDKSVCYCWFLSAYGRNFGARARVPIYMTNMGHAMGCAFRPVPSIPRRCRSWMLLTENTWVFCCVMIRADHRDIVCGLWTYLNRSSCWEADIDSGRTCWLCQFWKQEPPVSLRCGYAIGLRPFVLKTLAETFFRAMRRRLPKSAAADSSHLEAWLVVLPLKLLSKPKPTPSDPSQWNQ